MMHVLYILVAFGLIKLMKGKALRKHSLYEKTAASVLLKLFISTHISIIPNLTKKEKIETTQTNKIISNKLLNLLDVHYSGSIQDI